MFLHIMLIVSVGMAFAEESGDSSVIVPVEPYETSLLQFSLTGTTNEPLWKNLRDAEITASSSLNQFSLPENLKGIHHSIWVAADNTNQWLTFSFAQVQTIDGIRVWNVMKDSAFKDYELLMSPNDGYEWYDIKKGTGANQFCCEYQEILFPVAHAKMFRLKMLDNHGTGIEKTSLSYIEFRFLTEPSYICPYYAVPYNNYCYAVLDRTFYDTNEVSCQSPLALPLGWQLATYSTAVLENVVRSPYMGTPDGDVIHWGTEYVIFANGDGYDTETGNQWTFVDDVDGITAYVINLIEHADGKYQPKWCDASGNVVTPLKWNGINNDLDVDIRCDSGTCTSKLLIAMAQNSTRRFNPPFVGREDINNNLVFDQTM